jgi:hypothetical protein
MGSATGVRLVFTRNDYREDMLSAWTQRNAKQHPHQQR